MVRYERGQALKKSLIELGCEVTWREYPMPHAVCMEEIVEIGAWLRERCRSEAWCKDGRRPRHGPSVQKLLAVWILASGCVAPPGERAVENAGPAPQRDVLAWVIEDIPCCGRPTLADQIERQTVLLNDPGIAALARAFEIEIVLPTDAWRFLSERVPASDWSADRQPQSVHRLRADGTWVGSVSLKSLGAREELRRLLAD
jgi:hypothetical protein